MLKGQRGNAWTTHEQALLRELFPEHKGKELAERLPRHTRESILKMARKLGLRKSEAFARNLKQAQCRAMQEAQQKRRVFTADFEHEQTQTITVFPTHRVIVHRLVG